MHQWRREPDTAYPQVESSLALADKVGAVIFRPRGLTLQGWVLAQRGQREEGIALIRRGIADYRGQGVDLFSTFMLAMLAELYGQNGEVEAGLEAITEALDLAHTYDERWWEADLHRLRAELLLQLDEPDASQAEAALHQALTVAREQEAKSLELRAATSLGRLWCQQGKREQARRLVKDIYNWFTEGFDTADLQDAKALLDELARSFHSLELELERRRLYPSCLLSVYATIGVAEERTTIFNKARQNWVEIHETNR